MFLFQTELNCQCPRCKIEMPKSKLNQHMGQAHGIKILNQLMKRSFNPSNFPVKIIKPLLDGDPLTLSQEEFNNNDIKTEKFINNDVNDYKGKKAKKRKIETSSESEDYDEKDLVEDESDDSMKMKTIKPVLDSDSLNLSQEEFIAGKSSSEELIIASTDPQYDKRLFIKLRVLYMKIAKPFLDSDPLTLSQEEFSSNNDVKTEQSFQESEEKIESEKFDFDFEINDDANDIKTELADEENFAQRKGSIMPLFPELEAYSFQCDQCPYSATSESNLTNHKEDAHQPSKVIEPSPPKEPSNVGYQLKEDITAQGLNPTIDQSTFNEESKNNPTLNQSSNAFSQKNMLVSPRTSYLLVLG